MRPSAPSSEHKREHSEDEAAANERDNTPRAAQAKDAEPESHVECGPEQLKEEPPGMLSGETCKDDVSSAPRSEYGREKR
jgi:hypothetical protein